MKITVRAKGNTNTLNSHINPRFGCCEGFSLNDTEDSSAHNRLRCH